MGNQQTTLSGIHPFRDPNDPTSEPPDHYSTLPTTPPPLTSKLIGFNPIVPQVTLLGDDPPTQQQQESSNKPFSEFDELFVVKPPTPPPRRISADLPPRRRSIKGLFGVGAGARNLSLRNLRFSRPDLNKLGSLLRWRKKKVNKGAEVYPVPPDAEKPSPPSKPEVFQEEDYFLLRWDRPGYDGGLPIIGYIIQHLELGLPQPDPDVERDDTQCWYSSEPGQVTSNEVMLNNLIPGTTYIFRIIAENLLGYSQPGDQSTPIVFNPHGELDDWFCPPVFIISLDEQYTVLEHERLTLTIEIAGQPYPLVKFYKDGIELKRELDPLKYIITSCGQKRSLTYTQVEVGDSGVIKVVGENEKGVVECSSVLVVEAPPRIRRFQKVDLKEPEENLSEEDQKLIKSSTSDDGVIFQSGELAKFKFVWSASPYPNICVYHEGDLVNGEEVVGSTGKVKNERVEVEVTDNIILVKIQNVQRDDRGEWTVRLDNVLGEDSATVILTVTDKPSRPGRPDVLQLSDNTVILKWSEPYDSGGFPIHSYIVEYYRSEWAVWLKATTTKTPYTKIRDLIPGSKYKFRVKAENLYGVSECSDESVELLITDLVSTLRSFAGEDSTSGGGDDSSAAAALLMKTVVEEEEEQEQQSSFEIGGGAVGLDEQHPSSVDSGTTTATSTTDKIVVGEEPYRPTPPRRKFDRGSTSSLSNKVSSGTMTDDGLAIIGTGGTLRETRESAPSPTPQNRLPQPTSTSSSSCSPKLLRVSLQPHVIVLDEPDEETLKPPEITPRRSRSPSPMYFNRQVILEESEPNSREKSPVNVSAAAPAPASQQPTTVSSIKTQLSDDHLIAQLQQQRPPNLQLQQQQQPIQIPIVQPIQSPTKKLYSRAEIIKSAATEDLEYYLSLTSTTTTTGATGDSADAEPEDHEEDGVEEDPELLKVKEALMRDELEDEDEEEEEEEEEEMSYEYDFDQLQKEYEEDKKRGMVSRQDSGVSGRSLGKTESFNEEEEDLEHHHQQQQQQMIRPGSVPYERPSATAAARRIDDDDDDDGNTRTAGLIRRGSFERAQSEVVVRRGPMMMDSSGGGRGYAGGGGGGYNRSGYGSGTFLHDRFTDYIAMKAASRNQKVGSSLRSLNSSSRYSSNEQLPQQTQQQQQLQKELSPSSNSATTRDSGRSSMQPEVVAPPSSSPGEQVTVVKRFRVRSFNVQDELEGMEKLERSVSKPSFRGTYDSLQGVRGTFNPYWMRGLSAPDLGDGGGGGGGSGSLADGGGGGNGGGERNRGGGAGFRKLTTEHAWRSERFDVSVPDSGLRMRGLMEGGVFRPGGVGSSVSESVEQTSGDKEDGSIDNIDVSLERDVPRERDFEQFKRMSLSEGEYYDEEFDHDGDEVWEEDAEGAIMMKCDEYEYAQEEEEEGEQRQYEEMHEEQFDEAEKIMQQRISLEELQQFKAVEKICEMYTEEEEELDRKETESNQQLDMLLSKLDKFLEEENDGDVEEEEKQIDELSGKVDGVAEGDLGGDVAVIDHVETVVGEQPVDESSTQEECQVECNNESEEKDNEVMREEHVAPEEPVAELEGKESEVMQEDHIKDDTDVVVVVVLEEPLTELEVENVMVEEEVSSELVQLEQPVGESTTTQGQSEVECNQELEEPLTNFEGIDSEVLQGEHIKDDTNAVVEEPMTELEGRESELFQEQHTKKDDTDVVLQEPLTEPGMLEQVAGSKYEDVLEDAAAEIQPVFTQDQENLCIAPDGEETKIKVVEESADVSEVQVEENKIQEKEEEPKSLDGEKRAELECPKGDEFMEKAKDQERGDDRTDYEPGFGESYSHDTDATLLLQHTVMEQSSELEVKAEEHIIDSNELTTEQQTDQSVITTTMISEKTESEQVLEESESATEPPGNTTTATNTTRDIPEETAERTNVMLLPGESTTIVEVEADEEGNILKVTEETSTQEEYSVVREVLELEILQKGDDYDGSSCDSTSQKALPTEPLHPPSGSPSSETTMTMTEQEAELKERLTRQEAIIDQDRSSPPSSRTKPRDNNNKQPSPPQRRASPTRKLAITSPLPPQIRQPVAAGAATIQPRRKHAESDHYNIPFTPPPQLLSTKRPTQLLSTSNSSLTTSRDSIMTLSPVAEERSPVPSPVPPPPLQKQQPLSLTGYAPDMSAYDRVLLSKRSSLSRGTSSLSSTRSSTSSLYVSSPPPSRASTVTRELASPTPPPPSLGARITPTQLLLLSTAPVPPPYQQQQAATTPSDPVPLSEIHRRLEESRNMLIQTLINNDLNNDAAVVAAPPLPPPIPVASSSSSPEKHQHQTDQPPISPFMTYLFNAAFYLMLSPILFFVDSLVLGLLCLLVIACVHYFFITME